MLKAVHSTSTTRTDLQKDIFESISHPISQSIYSVYDLISQSIRDYLTHESDFLEYKPPLIGPVTDPGIRGAKQVEVDYYGKTYKFMSSAILYKQLLALSRKHSGASGKIYFFADNLRLEPLETASTSRHLVEFVQVDLELADADHHEAMDVAEGLVIHIYKSMRAHKDLLASIWSFYRDTWESKGLVSRSDLSVPSKFKRYTHHEAVEVLKSELDSRPEIFKQIQKQFGIKPKSLNYDAEIPWEYEWLLSSLHDEPFFIHDYPKGARGFYDREYPDKPGLLMDFDLIMPHGYGEVISGAAREYQLEKIIPRMKETGESLQKYEWYLKFLREHGGPTAGFGIGLERTVRYFAGLPEVHLALPYPKIPGIYSP